MGGAARGALAARALAGFAHAGYRLKSDATSHTPRLAAFEGRKSLLERPLNKGHVRL